MKKIIKTALCFTFLLVSTVSLYAQTGSVQDTVVASPSVATFGKIKSYDIRVTFDKTTHLIFPSAIRYVDLGNENITAGKVEGAGNVLRVKATVRDFEEETNLSVITEEGRFYSFNVRYSIYPEILNVDFLKSRSDTTNGLVKEGTPDDVALFNELGNDPPALAQLAMKTIYKQDKRFIRHIGAESFGIRFLLKGIYTQNGKLYFHTQIYNATNIPFTIDFLVFKVADKKVAKRTVIQERIVEPLRTFRDWTEIEGKSNERNVFLLEKLTIPDDKLLLIEIFEKNGGRHQVLTIENNDLVKARLVKSLHIKF